MMRLRISAILLILSVLLAGCSTTAEPEETITEETAVAQTSETSSDLPSREFFENLDKGSSLDEIVEQIGPCGYEGSGIIYHVWMLDDGSKAELVFNSEGIIEFIYIVSGDNSERIYDRPDS